MLYRFLTTTISARPSCSPMNSKSTQKKTSIVNGSFYVVQILEIQILTEHYPHTSPSDIGLIQSYKD